MPSGLQTHPFAIPIRRKQLRTSIPINHGPTSSKQKSDSPQKKSRNQHISEKNRSNAKPPHQPSGAGAKQLQPG